MGGCLRARARGHGCQAGERAVPLRRAGLGEGQESRVLEARARARGCTLRIAASSRHGRPPVGRRLLLPSTLSRTVSPANSHTSRVPTAHVGCDFCRAELTRRERRRIVWETGIGSEVVLADLCGRCAARADALLERYGGQGRSTLRLITTSHHPAPARKAVGAVEREPRPAFAALAFLARSAIYLMIGVAAFLLVTLVVARPW